SESTSHRYVEFQNGQPSKEAVIHTSAAKSDTMAVFQKGRPLKVWSGSRDKTEIALDWIPKEVSWHPNPIAISADGQLIAAVSGKTIASFDGNKYSERAVKEGLSHGLACVAISPDERFIATGGSETSGLTQTRHFDNLIVWDAKTLN